MAILIGSARIDERGKISGGRAGSCDRNMSEFVTTSKSRTVTAHGIFNIITKIIYL